MDMSQAIKNTYDWAKTQLESAGYSVILNPAVPPKSLDNHAVVWVEGADFDPETFGRSYRGRVSLLVQVFKGVSQVPLHDTVSAMRDVNRILFSSMPTGATSLRLTGVELGTSGEFVIVEVRLEVEYHGLQPT